MAKILSTNINVYPTGFRGVNDGNQSFDPESIYNTEDNSTRPYKFIANGDYVVTGEYSSGEEFNIILGGYYFRIREFNVDSLELSGEEIYTHIKVNPKGTSEDNTNTRYVANSLVPLDSQNKDNLDSKSGQYYFDGLILDNSSSNDGYSSTLLILKKSDGSWVVPEESKLRFSPEYIRGGTNYNTSTSVGLDKQLDTKLIYNPDGRLTVQGKDQVEIKSVDSNNDAKVKTIWKTTEESIYSTGKTITQEANEKSDNGFDSKITLDKYSIELSKFKNENTISTCKILDNEILLENKDVSSIGPSGKAAISLKTFDGYHSSINLDIEDDVYNSRITLDQYGMEVLGNNNSIIGATDIRGSSPGQNINIKTESNSKLNIISTGANSPINISAGTTCNLSGRSSLVSFVGVDESSAKTLIKLEESNITTKASSILTTSAPTIRLKASENNYISILNNSNVNGLVLFPSVASNQYSYVGTSDHKFTHGYIDNLNSSQITINASHSSGSIRVNVGVATSSNYGLIVASNASSSQATKISPVCVITQSYYATSDRRLKENIKPFNYSKAITDIEVKEFNFKGDKNKTIGIIAQDLQEIYPELVHENENGYLSIQEDKLIYLLLEEVKELKKEVNNLKNIKK